MWKLGTFIQEVQPSLADLMSLNVFDMFDRSRPGDGATDLDARLHGPAKAFIGYGALVAVEGDLGFGQFIRFRFRKEKTMQSGSKWKLLGCPDCNRLGMPVLRRYLQVACQCVRRSRTMLTGLSPVFKKFWCLVEIVVRVRWLVEVLGKLAKGSRHCNLSTSFQDVIPWVYSTHYWSLPWDWLIRLEKCGAAALCFSMVGLTDFHRRKSRCQCPIWSLDQYT